MQDFMKYWADNYQLGIGIITGVLVIIYILVSIFSIRVRRKRKGDISLLGMIPLFHIALFFMGKPKKAPDGGEIVEDMF